ncbi:hypothetical protein TNCV_478221 [Trichonephila clavipes]|nr:hypothetical protein TNCV_478221 [Trichonephila clavipes]
MDENHTTKKASMPIHEGRPNLRWIDVLEKDILVLGTKNWNKKKAGLEKVFLRRPRPTLSFLATEQGRICRKKMMKSGLSSNP